MKKKSTGDGNWNSANRDPAMQRAVRTAWNPSHQRYTGHLKLKRWYNLLIYRWEEENEKISFSFESVINEGFSTSIWLHLLLESSWPYIVRTQKGRALETMQFELQVKSRSQENLNPIYTLCNTRTYFPAGMSAINSERLNYSLGLNRDTLSILWCGETYTDINIFWASFQNCPAMRNRYDQKTILTQRDLGATEITSFFPNLPLRSGSSIHCRNGSVANE